MSDTTHLVHLCGGCNHSEDKHREMGGCCGGYCRCRVTSDDVAANSTAIEMPIWPGYDQATGRWSS